MNSGEATSRLRQFVERYGNIEITSTGATVVDYKGVLYNVDGSSEDPEIDGSNWKGLLVSYDIDADCYVINQTPEKNSHPEFTVGGHMTPNRNGEVEVGADSYLMPLCSWHNNTARNGVAFKHNRTKMLKLSGFMQGELAVTFMARLPSEQKFSLVRQQGNGWINEKDEQQVKAFMVAKPLASGLASNKFILFERVERDGADHYRVVDYRL